MDGLEGKKIAVVGAGAVGAYYGGMLARAGLDVHLLLRSDFEVVKTRGLVIHSRGETFQVPVQAASHASEIGPVDLVLIAIKATANPVLEELLPPLIGAHTSLLTLQNGLGNDEFLASRWGAERVLGGLCFVCLNRIGPGEILHLDHGMISVGEYVPAGGGRPSAVAEALRAAGVAATAVQNLTEERWRKLVWNIPFNGLSIAAGAATVADILASEVLKAEASALMDEVLAAAESQGYDIPRAFADLQIERSESMGDYRSSSLIDWENGRPVEVEAIWGEPLRRAQAAGIRTPRLSLLHALIRRLTAG